MNEARLPFIHLLYSFISQHLVLLPRGPEHGLVSLISRLPRLQNQANMIIPYLTFGASNMRARTRERRIVMISLRIHSHRLHSPSGVNFANYLSLQLLIYVLDVFLQYCFHKRVRQSSPRLQSSSFTDTPLRQIYCGTPRSFTTKCILECL